MKKIPLFGVLLFLGLCQCDAIFKIPKLSARNNQWQQQGGPPRASFLEHYKIPKERYDLGPVYSEEIIEEPVYKPKPEPQIFAIQLRQLFELKSYIASTLKRLDAGNKRIEKLEEKCNALPDLIHKCVKALKKFRLVCPEHSVLYKHMCYHSHGEKKPFPEARQLCLQKGGSLITPLLNSDEFGDDLQKLINEKFGFRDADSSGFWLNGHAYDDGQGYEMVLENGAFIPNDSQRLIEPLSLSGDEALVFMMGSDTTWKVRADSDTKMYPFLCVSQPTLSTFIERAQS